MKGKVVGVVQNSVVIKVDVITDTEGIMSRMNSKGEIYTNKDRIFNPNKLLDYEILYNDKSVGKISDVIGRISDFFLVGDIQNKDIASAMVGKDVEILKQNRKRKKQQKPKPYKR